MLLKVTHFQAQPVTLSLRRLLPRRLLGGYVFFIVILMTGHNDQ